MGNTTQTGGLEDMGANKGNAKRNVKEPIAGPWDWRSLLPRCEHDLDDLRTRATEEAVRNPELGIHLGRWLRWVEGTAKGLEVGPSGNSTLARYRRFLFELQSVGPDRHEADADEELPCALRQEADLAAA